MQSYDENGYGLAMEERIMRFRLIATVLLAVMISACAGENPVATVETSMGQIRIELYRDKMPKTVKNFIKLADDGFYNDQIVNMVTPGFIVKAGCPDGTGKGGPGYLMDPEPNNETSHDHAGMVSMYNQNNTGIGSQFFITLTNLSYLDAMHPVFGEVISGMDVVTEIGRVEIDADQKPLTDIIIYSITVK